MGARPARAVALAALCALLFGASSAGAVVARFSTVTCAATVTTLVTEHIGRTKLLVVNPSGGATVTFGPTTAGTTLTTSNGLPLLTGESFSAYGGETKVEYQCISAAGVTVRVMESFE
ncbi:MAG: hypothetical protein A3E78_16715 [Alphaproteobacteria bacterium RIFCSPHIGHO2_12_FULL_63_12]|nr:MAG: hypothetical protein A3E78_16715 [Alphaproteobacteria bacterium RIFCSPHIGHO2_12_FULL_63_12]